MNQEEWLAERRRLGLPADPAKDFPPNYRHDPDEESDRFSREHPERRTSPPAGQPSAAQAERARLAAARRADDAAALARLPAPPAQSSPPRSPAGGAPAGQPMGAPAGPAPSQGQGPYPGPQGQPGARPWAVAPRPLSATRTTARKPRMVRFLAPLLVLVFIVGSQIVRSASHSSQSRDSFSTSSSYAGVTDAETEAETAATNSVDALFSGDLSELGFSTKLNPTVDTSALTPAAAAVAFGSDPTFSIDSTDVYPDETEAVVDGTLTSENNLALVSVHLMRSSPSQKWVVKPLALPVLQGFDGIEGTFKVNGVSVDLTKIRAAGKELAVWPGLTTVIPPADKYTSWPQDELSQEYTGDVDFGGYGSDFAAHADPQTFSVEPVRTSAFTKDAKTAALANLDRCIAARDIQAIGCPFYGSLPSDVTRTRNVEITLIKAPSHLKVVGNYAAELLSSTPGKVDASGQGLHAGSWTPFRGTLQVDLNGSVGTKNGKVVYRE